MRTLFFSTTALCLACGAEYTVDPEAANSYIKAGTSAQEFTGSCLIDMFRSATPKPSDPADYVCSGALISPSLVLTAGHCTAGFLSFKVNCPYLHQSSWGSGISHPNYHEGKGGTVAMDTDDIGLVRLQSRILAPSYPTVRATKVPDGTTAVAVGRVLNSVPSAKELYRSAPIQLQDATRRLAYPHAYAAPGESIQPGDSGGPVYLQGAKPQQVVAVNSGSGIEYAIFSRLDLVVPWLLDQVNQAGGWQAPAGILAVTPRAPDVAAAP